MNAIINLKNRKIDNHIKAFTENNAQVEVIRYVSKYWATIKTRYQNHDFIIDVPTDVLQIVKCDQCNNLETLVGITRCKTCGDNDAI